MNNYINNLIGNYQNKTKELSREIHGIHEEHVNYQKEARQQLLKNALIDDMVSMAVIVAIINLLTIIIFKYPGFLACLSIDALLFTTIPVIDFTVRGVKTYQLVKKNRIRMNNEINNAKDVLDKYYEKIVELNKINKEINNIEDNSYALNTCKKIEETIIDDYVPETNPPKIEKVNNKVLSMIFKN